MIVLVLLIAVPCPAQELADLQVGHWIKVKGRMREDGFFVASEVEVLDPDDEEELIGDVERVDGDSFWVLGQEIHVSDRTEWEGVTLGDLEGKRVEVEGHYRGPFNFSAREISARKGGRDRIVGRVDDIGRTDGDTVVRIMRYEVRLPKGTDVESTVPLREIALAPAREYKSGDLRRSSDDEIPGSIYLTDDLRFGALVEYKIEEKDNANLNERRDRDETQQRASVSVQLGWQPDDHFLGMFRGKYQYEDERKEEEVDQSSQDLRVSELWGRVRGVGLDGLDVLVGRQKFNDAREWIYDENLDALRVVYSRPGFEIELSASTVLSDGSERNEETDNLMLYVSNGDDDRHLAAWIVDRRDDRGVRDWPIHFGVRALGEWLPDNESWAELSLLRGYTDDVDLESYGFDLGSTWEPGWAGPFRFTAGYAFGSGDDDLFDGKDERFRQTGLQDNNGKLGGVTSFKYYGEVVDPELSNMGIWTAGLGVELARRTSLDLVYHHYEQDEAADTLFNTSLRKRPDGVHEDLGWGLDLVFGTRALPGWDIEVVLGMFEPGDAFPGATSSYLAALQIRYRF